MRTRPRPRHATVLACLALLLALSGTAIAAGLANNSVLSRHIKNGQVRSQDLQNNAVIGAKIAPGAVTGAQLADLAVTVPKLANGAVTAEKLADGSVTSGKVADNALTGADINEATLAPLPLTGAAGGDLIGNFPDPSLAPGSVHSGKVANDTLAGIDVADDGLTGADVVEGTLGQVPAAANAGLLDNLDSNDFLKLSTPAGGDLTGSYPSPLIGPGAVDTAELAGNSVNSAKVGLNALTGDDVDESTLGPVPGAGTLDGFDSSDFLKLSTPAGGDLTGSYPAPLLALNSVDSEEIAVDAVDSSEIAGDAVDSGEIAADAVNSGEIATDAVDTGEIATDAVDAGEIATDAVDTGEIAADAVDAGEIALDAVDTPELATDAVDAEEIASDAVDTPELATDAVDEDEIASDAVDSPELATDSVDATEIALDAVDTPELATDAVEGDEIADGEVDDPEITDNAVDETEIENGSVEDPEIADNAVDETEIEADAIADSEITDEAVDETEIEDASVATEEFAPLPAAIVSQSDDTTVETDTPTALSFNIELADDHLAALGAPNNVHCNTGGGSVPSFEAGDCSGSPGDHVLMAPVDGIYRITANLYWLPSTGDSDGDGVTDDEDWCPDSPGRYSNGCGPPPDTLDLTGTAAGFREAALEVTRPDGGGGDVVEIVAHEREQVGPGGNGLLGNARDPMSISAVVDLKEGQYVELLVYQNSGSDQTIVGAGSAYEGPDGEVILDDEQAVEVSMAWMAPSQGMFSPNGDDDTDGVPNYADACPTQSGDWNTQGCPDNDFDGVANADDACPNVWGSTGSGGCPDWDGDGVSDIDDQCGAVNNWGYGSDGCFPPPDRDGDGVDDGSDTCPTAWGSQPNGCEPDGDKDSDGVPDSTDACPVVFGTDPSGCRPTA